MVPSATAQQTVLPAYDAAKFQHYAQLQSINHPLAHMIETFTLLSKDTPRDSFGIFSFDNVSKASAVQVTPDAALRPGDFADLMDGMWFSDTLVSACMSTIITHHRQTSFTVDYVEPAVMSVQLHASSAYLAALATDKSAPLPPSHLDIDLPVADLLLIPQCIDDNHWVLYVAQRASTAHGLLWAYNSTASYHQKVVKASKAIAHALRPVYSSVEARFDQADWNCRVRSSGQQTNGFDCGAFVVVNALTHILSQSPVEHVEGFRERLAGFLLSAAQGQSPDPEELIPQYPRCPIGPVVKRSVGQTYWSTHWSSAETECLGMLAVKHNKNIYLIMEEAKMILPRSESSIRNKLERDMKRFI